MESDTETSVESSVSSLMRRALNGHAPRHGIEMDVDSDNEDYEMSSRLRNERFNSNAHSGHQEGPISKMPPEVLLLIFSLVSHKPDLVPLLTVCKRWGDLIVELLWFRPSLMNGQAKRGIYEVMKKNRNETYWDYRNYIRRLNLSFICEKVDNQFLELFEGCPNLERLTLVNCMGITPEPIIGILKGCSKLQSIDVTGLASVDDTIFNALADNCPRLQGIYAPGCPFVSNEAIIKVTDKCPLLKRVKITDNYNITDNALIELTSKCKALIELDVHNCPNLTDESLGTVFLNSPQLRELRVSSNPNLSDNMLRNLNENANLDRLRILDLSASSRITDRFVERIVLAAPRLRNVILSKCLNITDSSLRALATLGKNLHYIHLGHCANITDFGVTTLVRSCHRLQYIDLACCTQLTNISLIELGSLPRLKRIGLVKCANINDAGMMNLIRRRGPGDTLERVHLSYCTDLTVYPIFHLLQTCPKLTHLSLTGIQEFLRPDFTQFCRPAPPDFTETQKALFCVFSGNGVRRLRNYLGVLCASLNNGIMIGDQVQVHFGTEFPPPFETLQNVNFTREGNVIRANAGPDNQFGNGGNNNNNNGGGVNERIGNFMNGGFRQVPRDLLQNQTFDDNAERGPRAFVGISDLPVHLQNNINAINRLNLVRNAAQVHRALNTNAATNDGVEVIDIDEDINDD